MLSASDRVLDLSESLAFRTVHTLSEIPLAKAAAAALAFHPAPKLAPAMFGVIVDYDHTFLIPLGKMCVAARGPFT